LFHADGRTNGRKDRRTDMTKLIAAFRNFANAPKYGTVALVPYLIVNYLSWRAKWPCSPGRIFHFEYLELSMWILYSLSYSGMTFLISHVSTKFQRRMLPQSLLQTSPS